MRQEIRANRCLSCVHWTKDFPDHVRCDVRCELPELRDYCISHDRPYWKRKWERSFHSLKVLNESIDFIKEEEMRL